MKKFRKIKAFSPKNKTIMIIYHKSRQFEKNIKKRWFVKKYPVVSEENMEMIIINMRNQ